MRDLNYSDIDELYEKTSLEVLKKTLSNFKEDNYIPLGLNDKNDIVCYLKTTKNIHAFSKTNADLLYTDAHNSGKQPDMKTAQTFYWKVREVCRLRGLIKPVRIYKYGVFPYGGDYFFWDSNNLYLLKDKVTKIDILSVISPDLLLLKYHNKKFPDMEKLKPLSKDELKKIFEPFYLFNLDKRDRKLLVGWIIQGLVAGGLPFRAPVWIHSPSGYGKSHLTDKLIRKYFTMYARQTGRTTTPKSIPRYFDGKAMPLQRDEFEPEAFRDREAREELSYIRMSASERFPSRSISKGVMSETIEFEWCVSALYTSIEKMPALTQADKMRFIFIDLNYSFDKNYFKKITAFQKLMTTEMRYRLLLTVLLKRKDIEKAHERLRQLPQCRHIQSHIKSAYFMLAVCYNTLNPFGERIDYSKLVHSMEKIQEEKKKMNFLRSLLYLQLHKSNYNLEESFTLIEILSHSRERHLLKDKGFYVTGKKLLLHTERAIFFLTRLHIENKKAVDSSTILSTLERHEEYFEGYQHREQKLHRMITGKYMILDFEKIKKDYIG